MDMHGACRDAAILTAAGKRLFTFDWLEEYVGSRRKFWYDGANLEG
jgi:hypothetical protein